MSELSEGQVRAALRSVPAPDGAANLAESPALSSISIVGSRVVFAIVTTPEQAASLENVRRAAEAAVRAVPGVTDVLVALTAERPPGAPSRPVAQPQRPAPDRGHAHSHGPGPGGGRGTLLLDNIRHVIAVASGKGGVGKSTVAANLAVALAQRGLKVGLLDADIYGPSAPILFGVTEKPRVDGKTLFPIEAHGVKLMSIGFLVDAEQAMIWRGPMVMSALTQMMRDVAWGDLDIVVVDMPPGTGDAQLTLAQQVRLAGAVIVSTPQDLALADARRGIAMFGKVNVPVLGLVENMSYFCCPNCGHRAEIFGHGGAEAEARRLGVPFLGAVPLDPEVRALSDSGSPVVAAAPASQAAQVYGEIAASVAERLQAGVARRAAPRIVIEG